MPNLANAEKALRQSLKRRMANNQKRNEIDTLRRKIRKALEAKKPADAQALVPTLQKHLGKAVKSGMVKANTAARTMSRTMAAIKKAA